LPHEMRNSHSWSGISSSLESLDQAMCCDVLQVVMLATNSLMLAREFRDIGIQSNAVKAASAEGQQEDLTLPQDSSSATSPAKRVCCCSRAALSEHFKSPWNLCNIGGILALYVASAAHFCDATFLLEQVGAVGVLLNAISFLELLQPLELTGPLIKVITETVPSVVGFTSVMAVLIWGFAASFAVSMPNNAAFITSNVTGYVTPGLLTTFMAMTGDSDVDQYQHVALATFILFLFLVNIVLFNVLIAIVSEIYDNTMATKEVDVRKRQAEVIIRQEAVMSDRDKSNTNYFPDYLEVLVKSGEFELQGPDGNPVQTQVEPSELSQVKQEVIEKHEALSAEVTAVKDSLAKVTAGQAELKAMMTQLLQQTTR
jgi:hypothetical protein